MRQKNKKPDAEKTKEKFKKTAAEVFAKNGFAATSVRMIAKKAKLNVSLISRYFGSKEGLFLSIVDQQIHRVTDADLPYLPMSSLEDELRHYMTSFLRDIAINRRFFRLVISHSFVDQKFLQNVKDKILPIGDHRLRERLALLKQSGVIQNEISIEDIELAITIFLRGIAIYEVILDTEEVEKLINEHVERVLRIIQVLLHSNH